jgi:hypothetical protein
MVGLMVVEDVPTTTDIGRQTLLSSPIMPQTLLSSKKTKMESEERNL